ncbi:MAG: transposase [Candidatus Dormiibacterota bacterium]
MTPVGAFVVSRTDPDAALISHSPRQKARLMHKVHMAVDGGRSRIVTAVTAVPASHGDGQGLPAILGQHEVTVGSLPQEAVADTGYATVTAFQACADRGVVASIPSWSTANRHGGWDREHFTYDTEHDRYVCPQGQQLRRTHDNLASRQRVYRAPFGVCPTCPVRQACGPGLRARTVTRSFDHELLEAARTHMEMAAGRAALRKRKQFIELVFADAKVRHCMARAQRRGRDNMLIQALLTAATMNLRKLIQFHPSGGVAAAAMGGLRSLQGAMWAVQCIVDWAASANSPFAALRCDLFALRLRRDSTPAFGNSLILGM